MRRLAACLLIASVACTQAVVDNTSTTYTPASGSTTVPGGWVGLGPMAEARSEHPAAVVGGEIVVAGGFIEVGVGRTSVTPTVEAYIAEAGSWHSLPDLPEARHHGMAATVGQRLFFMGGTPRPGIRRLPCGSWSEVSGSTVARCLPRWLPGRP